MTDDVYRSLQRDLDRLPVPFPATASGVELRILKHLFSPLEARVATELGMIPEPAAGIHRRLRGDLALDDVRKMLDSMADRGLILRTDRTRPKYSKSPFVVGFYEMQVNRLSEAFERDFLQYLDEALGAALHTMKTPQMRTVPVNRSIPAPDRLVGRYDDITAFVRATEGPFAVMNCICQQGRDLLAEPCRLGDHRQHCLMFGDAARGMIARGDGRPITREEMLALVERADRDGLVLQPQNTQDPMFICCCCGCCCGVLTAAKKLPKPAEFFFTNYHAEVESGECLECGTCAIRCQMDAVSTGGGPTHVDLSRCIGCGLCISTCESGAMRLVPNPVVKTPPADMIKLYTQMYRERYGPLALLGVVVRKTLGMKT